MQFAPSHKRCLADFISCFRNEFPEGERHMKTTVKRVEKQRSFPVIQMGLLERLSEEADRLQVRSGKHLVQKSDDNRRLAA